MTAVGTGHNGVICRAVAPNILTKIFTIVWVTNFACVVCFLPEFIGDAFYVKPPAWST